MAFNFPFTPGDLIPRPAHDVLVIAVAADVDVEAAAEGIAGSTVVVLQCSLRWWGHVLRAVIRCSHRFRRDAVS